MGKESISWRNNDIPTIWITEVPVHDLTSEEQDRLRSAYDSMLVQRDLDSSSQSALPEGTVTYLDWRIDPQTGEILDLTFNAGNKEEK